MAALAFVMAGGKGSRLAPLTSNRSKPAVPFGGRYRIIDFVLSNLVNSGVMSIYVLTQFKSQSLTEHLFGAWNIHSILPNQFVTPVPAQQRTGEHWYQGTADAIYQNLNLVDDKEPDTVLVFGADHIFLMNVDHMMEFGKKNDADCTIACLPVPIEEASQFGVVQVDEDWRIIGFQEKPENPTPIPGNESMALVSMGNYVFDRKVLTKALMEDACDAESSHDFGKNVLPTMLAEGKRLYAYDFRRNRIEGCADHSDESYWRDVGTLDAYFEANMDLRAIEPELDMYNKEWPVRCSPSVSPPPKFVHNANDRVGRAVQSIVCEGTIISGGTVVDSVVGRDCCVHSYAKVSQCVLMDGAVIGRNAKLNRCIIDKNVHIPDGVVIGFNEEEDRKHYHVTDNGVVVISRETEVYIKPEPVVTIEEAPPKPKVKPTTVA